MCIKHLKRNTISFRAPLKVYYSYSVYTMYQNSCDKKQFEQIRDFLTFSSVNSNSRKRIVKKERKKERKIERT